MYRIYLRSSYLFENIEYSWIKCVNTCDRYDAIEEEKQRQVSEKSLVDIHAFIMCDFIVAKTLTLR